MKIAIASDDGQQIAMHTGQCGCFVIYEVDAGRAERRETRPNRFTPHARGECDGFEEKISGEPHRHKSHHDLLTNLGDCQVLVARGMGPRLVADLANHGIRPFLCDAEEVEQAAQQFAAGQLQEIQGLGPCRHHMPGPQGGPGG